MSEQPEALRLADALEFGVLLGDERDAAAEKLRSLHAENERLREAARMALAVLEQWDDLIEYQYTGTRPAMDAMHHAAQATVPVVKALRAALGGEE